MADANMLRHIPQLTPENMGKILKHLPGEPEIVEVSLYGPYDYSSLYKQATEALPPVKISTRGGTIFEIEDPSKERIIEIYKQSHGLIFDNIPVNTPEYQQFARDLAGKRRVEFHRALWKDAYAEATLTPWKLDIEHDGSEPSYAAQIREEFAGTDLVVLQSRWKGIGE